MEDLSGVDICRVCRSEGLPERPLFHPCICTGSIKWIHQECLVQWMRYSRKEFCELCGHRFSFTPIYSPDMPRRLPVKDVVGGLLASVATAVKYWLHYTLVAVAWLGVVPLTACRIYRCLFFGSLEAIFSFPLDMLSTDNLASDVFHGCFVVTCTLFAFIGLVWLREQILHGGGPEWLENEGGVVGAHEDNAQNANGAGEAAHDHVDDNQNNVAQAQALPDGEGAQAGDVGDVDDENEANGGDENNWMPMEWDRAAEELTWERLLGLDGSLVFLEHVFWVISLNTLFVFIFAFCPYHMGVVVLSLVRLRDATTRSHFEGLLTTLLGYCLVGMFLVVLHRVAALVGFRRAPRILGLCYVVVKVAMLSVVEIGILPLVCGWWLDICSLAMFDASLKDREANFKLAPGTSIFIHWLVGMIYVYYFASFVLLLREVLRPGVLWFLRNLNDPDFSPIQEMIHLPIFNHIRRLLLSAIIFGTAVLLMLWLPVQLLKMVWSQFLPYVIAVSSDAQVNELSLELLLLQVIIPALLEQSHTRIWLKGLIRMWCIAVAWLLNIHSYLLGSGQPEGDGGGNNQQPEPAGGLAAEHQAILTRDGPTGFQPYDRPRFFAGRIFLLLLLVCTSLVVASLATLTIPVWIGRQVMTLWLNGSLLEPELVATAAQTSVPKIHELYTAACGTYICWIIARATALVVSWLPQGRDAMVERLTQWARIGAKTVIASALLLGVIPLLSGLLLEVVIVIPLRVPIHQTPILFIWQDWALGVLYTKIACAVTMMGPEWFVRTAIERVYRDGIRDMNLRFVCRELAAPVIVCFGLALAIPYVLAYSIVPLLVTNPHMCNLIARRIYPFLLLLCIAGALVTWQVRQFRKLYEHIKNDKYLVGQRLVNYDHRRQKERSN